MTDEITINSNEFEYLGKKFECGYAIKRDTQNIIREAKSSHSGDFERLYDTNSLKPSKMRLYFEQNTPIYCMIIYTIDYKDQKVSRLACGDYYPLHETADGFVVAPHPFQASICW